MLNFILNSVVCLLIYIMRYKYLIWFKNKQQLMTCSILNLFFFSSFGLFFTQSFFTFPEVIHDRSELCRMGRNTLNCQGGRRNLIFFFHFLFFSFESIFVAGSGELLAVDRNTLINVKVFFCLLCKSYYSFNV